MAEMALITVEGACQLLMAACDRPPEPARDQRPATIRCVSGTGTSGLVPSFPLERPRIMSTDLDVLRLLRTFGDVSSVQRIELKKLLAR